MYPSMIFAFLAAAVLPLGSALSSPADEDGVLEPPPAEPLWRFQTSGQIWSSAVHDQGTLYFGSLDGGMYAVELIP